MTTPEKARRTHAQVEAVRDRLLPLPQTDEEWARDVKRLGGILALVPPTLRRQPALWMSPSIFASVWRHDCNNDERATLRAANRTLRSAPHPGGATFHNKVAAIRRLNAEEQRVLSDLFGRLHHEVSAYVERAARLRDDLSDTYTIVATLTENYRIEHAVPADTHEPKG